MVTRISPALAAANWVSVHSARLSDQIPMRSPGFIPSPSNPAAKASALSRNSRQVQRVPVPRSISARRSPHCAAASSSACPMVLPNKGVSDTPET
jgi:hypothetical protein